MATCICCGGRVCTRNVPFRPELGGYLCFDCKTDEDFIQRRKEEVEYLINQNN